MDGRRPVKTGSRLNDLLTGRGSRVLLIVAALILLLAGAVGGYIFGRQRTYNEVIAGNQLVQQLQTENQTLNRQIIEQSTNLGAMQSKLKNVQDTLNAIKPTENTYNIHPNQSLILGDGRMTVGLIGSPANQGVELNINGTQHSLAAGDVVKISPDGSANCQLALQSFDMFKAVVNASCAVTKPQ